MELKLVAVMRIILLAIAAFVALYMMYSDPIKSPTASVFNQKIVYAECPTDKYARPYFTIKENGTRFYVIKEFTYRSGCSNERESSIVGKSASFIYFNDAHNSAKVIEISLDGEKVYDKSEFVGKITSTGALLFILLIAVVVYFFVMSIRAKNSNKN